jgi:myo-inositol 2-dehydrogenase/D-chiro-inositol 1-dehydrogenase
VSTNVNLVSVGLIGCGQIAQSVHLKILQSLPGTRLIAIADPDASSREAAARLAPAARVVADYHDVLSRDDVHAVVLALPSGQHADAAVAAFGAGKHVYLEKPLATNLRDAEAAVGAWQRAGRVGMIGFNYRFNSLYRRARDLIGHGGLGEPLAVRSVFALAAQPLAAWKTRRATGGGVLLDLASHHVDLIRFLFDTDICDLTCDVQSRSSEGDTAFLQARLGNGATVQSFFSFGASDEDRFEIYGTAGKLTIDRCHAMDLQYRGPTSAAYRADQLRHVWGSLQRIGYGLERRRAFGGEPSWQLALNHFIEAVRGEHPAEPDFRDGFESLKIVLAAERAAATSGLQRA